MSKKHREGNIRNLNREGDIQVSVQELIWEYSLMDKNLIGLKVEDGQRGGGGLKGEPTTVQGGKDNGSRKMGITWACALTKKIGVHTPFKVKTNWEGGIVGSPLICGEHQPQSYVTKLLVQWVGGVQKKEEVRHAASRL